ncbi:MAG TPA: L-rhamnose/proton symporter RhaT [Dongiaceae bacterium]|nr:L-rhamnose/proton symporter RhaT [Dongiaceae bacterium]
MITAGIALATLSGLFNGLFTTPMKLEPKWKWENIWLVFIVVACLLMPAAVLLSNSPGWTKVLILASHSSVLAALLFGFAWGFGAICFGRSVHSIGVSMANTLVIGLSSALGSLVPLLMKADVHLRIKEFVLFAGVFALLVGVAVCGKAGRIRDGQQTAGTGSWKGYLLAVAAGVMSAIFNIGYALALPISDTGVALGLTRFAATNPIWMLMLGAGSVPNIVYCARLMARNQTASLLYAPHCWPSWGRSSAMGLLWGGSIFLYGAATPRLGTLGPSVGWPLSLAVGLVVANLMGVLLGEWREVAPRAVKLMWAGVVTLLAAVVLCGFSARFPE